MESISVFDIFKIGVGPSSSHTMGPWRAAQRFLNACGEELPNIISVRVDLYGSLAKTGKGHGTDIAVILGLCNEDPETIDPAAIPIRVAEITERKSLPLNGGKPIQFDPDTDIVFNRDIALPFHPNALQFTAIFEKNAPLSETYYSVGGGFVVQENVPAAASFNMPLPMPIESADDLLHHCRNRGLNIPEVVRENECAWRSNEQIDSGLQRIWKAMEGCVFRGCNTEGTLPGGLSVTRRAGGISRKLLCGQTYTDFNAWIAAVRACGTSFEQVSRWVSCFALAVNEENAAFGRVVTAPTNGAAGVIPAVMMYYLCCKCTEEVDGSWVEPFLLTAGEIGSIFKKGATLSAAMGGCQAEIGVSSAMAAAGLTQCMGGTVEQVLMAAEIAMEHHLGLTCDPVGGLVQVPCIERNTMGAHKAITATYLALEGDPSKAKVSLDTVVKSMWQTALDMNTKYKETSEGGLALQIPVSVAEC